MNDDLESLIKRIKMLKNLQEHGSYMTFGESEIENDDDDEATLVHHDNMQDLAPMFYGLGDIDGTKGFSDDITPTPARTPRCSGTKKASKKKKLK
jgi:hypothetical protein